MVAVRKQPVETQYFASPMHAKHRVSTGKAQYYQGLSLLNGKFGLFILMIIFEL